MSNLDVALEYLVKYRFSVVPWKPNKRGSLIPTYKEYQGRLPTEDEVREWWTKWPDAMIGVITGPVSDLMALDFDWYKLTEAEKKPLIDLVPMTIPGPVCISPEGGYHRLFRYSENGTVLNSCTDILKGFDIRALKGVITMPPSINQAGLAYRWMGGRALSETAIASLNKEVFNNIIKLINTSNSKGHNKELLGQYNKTIQTITKHNIVLDYGKRDETIFYIANHLAKGGMDKQDIYKTLEIIAKNCNPPFEQEEIPVKIESAFNRIRDKERNITDELRKYISITNGCFSVTEASQSITFHNKATVRSILYRLYKNEGIIEPDKKRGDGWYRRVDREEVEINFKDAKGEWLDIKYPLGIERFFKTAPKNIIVVAGEVDSGKTCWLLNFAALNNWNSMGITYFSSEMGEFEMQERMKKFTKPVGLGAWKMKAIERSSDFADVIRPDGINIIDFLEMHEDFFKVGLYIKQIFDKLNKGIAVIALQKNPGKDQGLGGMRSIEKARLSINLERGGRAVIDKAKNWATENNPRGLEIFYKIVGGWDYRIIKDWEYADGVRNLGDRKQTKPVQEDWRDQF